MEMVRYWEFLRSYLLPLRLRLALLALLLFGTLGLQLYSPTVLRTFIDAVRSGARSEFLARLGLLFLLAALLQQALTLAATYLAQDVGWRATNRLRSDLTRHCLTQDPAFYKQFAPGALMERVDGDVTTLSNLFSQFTLLVLANLLLLLGTLVVLLRVDWRAGLVTLLFAGLNLAVLARFRNLAAPHWQESRKRSADLFGFLGERLGGREDIRANGMAPHVMSLFFGLLRGRVDSERKAGRATAVMLIITFGFLALGISVAFALGTYLVTTGAITVGTAFMIFYYIEQLRRPVEQISAQLQDLGRATGSLQRIQELLDRRSALTEGRLDLPPGAPDLRFDQVSFRYEEGGAEVLQSVTLRLQPGQVLGVVGRTGSGKTTLARLAARLHDPTAGRVLVGGVDLRDLRFDSLRSQLALVTQDVQLLSATLRDNLTLFGAGVSDEQLRQVLAELGLADWCASLPDGLDTMLGPGGVGLSAGEAQLVALARAFLREPALLLLDEPSSRLDPATEARIERALDRLLRGRTALIIAHRLSTLDRADQILVLEGGAVAESGDRGALAADPGSRFHALLRQGLGEVPA